MKDKCPWCGAQVFDVTCSGDTVRSFICARLDGHSWTEVLEPNPEELRERLIILP